MPDAAAAEEIMALLSRLNSEYGKTVIMVTHDPHAASYATRICRLEKGALLPEESKPVEISRAGFRQ